MLQLLLVEDGEYPKEPDEVEMGTAIGEETIVG
jgi:hypothetical protein